MSEEEFLFSDLFDWCQGLENCRCKPFELVLILWSPDLGLDRRGAIFEVVLNLK